MKLIVGLGNIGKQYEGTRHNVGFMAVDAFTEDLRIPWNEEKKHHAFIAEARVEGEKTLLVKPTTYMNRSGQAVQSIASFYKILPEDILIVHDDMDIAPGRMQFKSGGGPAGHNGVEDIQNRLGTAAIPRLRIGIGRPEHPEVRSEDWVLGRLSPDHALNSLDIISGMRDWIVYGVSEAANRWN